MKPSIASASVPDFKPQGLQAYCRQLQFGPGEMLRRKGQHYRDMFLLDSGSVVVDIEASGHAKILELSGSGVPIGEIGFLRGCPATATVTARTGTVVLVLDDAALARLEGEQPAVAASLLRHLALTAEERTSFNLTQAATAGSYAGAQAVDVYLCRNADMLESAKRLRYEVYCQELGRDSPFADHGRKTISDPLDAFGNTFIALEAGEIIGTLRANLAAEGPLGVMEELYGMHASPWHPSATAVCTKFIVRKARRGGPASIKLISALAGLGNRNSIRQCFIDCVPTLLPFYRALGFEVTGEKFLHRENGPSFPMRIDLVRHGGRLSMEGGARDYLKIFARAQAIRLVERLRRGQDGADTLRQADAP